MGTRKKRGTHTSRVYHVLNMSSNALYVPFGPKMYGNRRGIVEKYNKRKSVSSSDFSGFTMSVATYVPVNLESSKRLSVKSIARKKRPTTDPGSDSGSLIKAKRREKAPARSIALTECSSPVHTAGYTLTEDRTTAVVSQAVIGTEVSLTSASENATATRGFSSVAATGHINTSSRCSTGYQVPGDGRVIETFQYSVYSPSARYR